MPALDPAAAPARGVTRRWRVPTAVVPPAAYAALAVLLTASAWRGSGPRLVGANGDAGHQVWYLAWVAFALTHGRNPFLITYLSPPGHPIGLMWQDAAPLLGLCLAPLTLAVSATSAYDVGMTAGMAASAWSAYWAIASLCRHRGPAWIGGLVFGFSPWILDEALAGHLFLVNLWLVPPLLLLLLRTLDPTLARGGRTGATLGGVAAGQLLISQEILADALLLGAGLTAALAVAHRRRLRSHLRPVARRLALAAGTFALLAGVPLAAALLGPGHDLHGRVENPAGDAADLLGLVVPTARQLLTVPPAARLAVRWEQYFAQPLYLGVPLLLVVGWALVARRIDPVVRGAAVVCVGVVILALGPHLRVAGVATRLPLPWAAIETLPVLGLAVPARIGAFAYLAAGVCLAHLLDRNWPIWPATRPAALALAAILPLLPVAGLPSLAVRAPAFFHGPGVRAIPAGSMAAVAGLAPGWSVEAMLWQAASGFRFRLPWGYAIQAGPRGRRVSLGPGAGRSTPCGPG